MSVYELESLVLEDYNISACFCRSEHIHGGVGILTHKSLTNVNSLDLSAFSSEFNCEFAGIKTNDIFIITVYRSPVGSLDMLLNNLELILNNVTKTDNAIILTGDFNIKFNEPHLREVIIFTNMLQSWGLKQTFFGSTRGYACLDNIFTNLDVNKYLVTSHEPAL